jgi:hypothetical protein
MLTELFEGGVPGLAIAGGKAMQTCAQSPAVQ